MYSAAFVAILSSLRICVARNPIRTYWCVVRREDGRKALPPFLNDLEHAQRYSPENAVVEQTF
jgi:hypothetical protein